MNIDQYVQAHQSGILPESHTDFFGRVIKSSSPDGFDALTDTPERRIVMIMNFYGLEEIAGLPGHETLLQIGYQSHYIDRLILEEKQFKLAVFPRFPGIRIASWHNVLAIVEETYPETQGVLAEYYHDLVYTPFDKIERQAGFRFSEVHQNGPDDPRYMTIERFLTSPVGLVEMRAFLYFAVGLYELFGGRGFTRASNGKNLIPEFIAPNMQLTEIEHRLIDLDVQPKGAEYA